MAKLINGNGNPAIYAGEDADLIASLAGNVTCIANVGNKYAATEEDANTIGLADGVIITKEGRRIQLDAGETDLFTIPTGSSGVTNYYIIGYKLVQNADSTQVAETFVQKMNSSSEIITENTFRGGATEVYVSLYRVTQVGFTIDSIDALLSKLLDSAAIKANIAQINTALSAKSPSYHASTASAYGLGSQTSYGHVKTINNLTTNNFQNGDALSAKQGYVLETNKVDRLLNDLVAAGASKTFQLLENKIYLMTAAMSGGKSRIDVINIMYGTLQFINLASAGGSIYINYNYDTTNKTIILVNMESDYVNLSITKL